MSEKKEKGLNKICFKSRLSNAIKAFYWSIFAFLLILILIVPLLVEMKLIEKIIFLSLFISILTIFVYILLRAYHMRYILTEEELLIKGIFKDKKINLKNIKEIEKTCIPFGFRLFGSSFLGGIYYLSGIGKTWVAMTNFKDGVLIKTKDKHNYLITPSKPKTFMDLIKKKLNV
ncbi:MAG: PH domain-containing protein [Candidatus Thermoplasmatota archaeon]